MFKSVGYRESPQPGPPRACFENKMTPRWAFLLEKHAVSAPMRQVVLGYMIPVAEVATHISHNTKLSFQ